MTKAQATSAEDEICKLKEIFAMGFLKKGAKLSASIRTVDGTVVPPQGVAALKKATLQNRFATVGANGTKTSKMSFSNYRPRFITPDATFVDADITLNHVSRGPYSPLTAYKERMGWTFKWVSSGGTEAPKTTTSNLTIRRCTALASFIRIRPARCSTPIRVMGAASIV